MQRYIFLDHTADVLFEAYGKTLNQLFTNAALALQEIQAELKTITPKHKTSITLKNKSAEMLLFDFLQELVYLKDAEELLFSKFHVAIKKEKNGYTLHADCWGEKINQKKHTLNVDAKAITLHQFEVKKVKTNWQARVIVDI
jgi:SHS2 domain-containing protein